MQVAASCLDGFVPEDALEDMEWDAGVCEPGCSGVPEPVPGEARQIEIRDELIPFRRVPHRCGSEHAAAGSGQQPVLGLTACGEALKHRGERLQDRDVPDVPSLGLFGDEPSCAWVGLAANRDDPLIPVDVADLKA